MRSKTLLIANLLATLYSSGLLWLFGGAVINAGGADFVEALGAYFELAFELLGTSSPEMNFLYALVILMCVHVIVFTLGSLIGWIAYVTKKSGSAKFAALLYLLGTVCFPVYALFGLPITVIGFVGGSRQKKKNRMVTEA